MREITPGHIFKQPATESGTQQLVRDFSSIVPPQDAQTAENWEFFYTIAQFVLEVLATAIG
jgi:hypothetical protein